MIYLAQPYSHEDPAVMDMRYNSALHHCAKLITKFVYSPIVHWHNISLEYNLSPNFAFWQELNLHMIEKANSVYVLKLHGWEQSIGLRGELEYCERAGKPVYTIEQNGDVLLRSPQALLKDMYNGDNNTEQHSLISVLKSDVT